MSEVKAAVEAQQYGLRVNLAYRLARHLVARRQARTGSHNPSAAWHPAVTKDWRAYADWRYATLRRQFDRYFGADTVKGKDALDFGCGDGALSTVLMDAGAARVHGIDLDERSLAQFAERLTRYTGERRPTFSRNTTATKISEPDQTFDAIYCLDVVEHIMDYRPIIHEWFRVLRPGGSVYIWWQPYWHPFGHHAYDWVPIPWVHALLSDGEINEVCARIVDWPGFDAPVWDLNPDGTRKNRFRAAGAGSNFLNKLTVHEFERHCGEAGFTLQRREFHPFTLPQPAKAISGLLTNVPLARDFFMACAVYQLARPS
jgi:SAM-dependent methyltransferase